MWWKTVKHWQITKHTPKAAKDYCSFHLLFLILSIYKAKIIGFYNETRSLIFTRQKSPMHHTQGKFIMRTWLENLSMQMLIPLMLQKDRKTERHSTRKYQEKITQTQLKVIKEAASTKIHVCKFFLKFVSAWERTRAWMLKRAFSAVTCEVHHKFMQTVNSVYTLIQCELKEEKRSQYCS